jgi:homoserine/homoserine lactone efflux protein
MNLNTWWLFVITGLVLDFTPGPAVLYVLSSALREGGRRSVFSSLGILTANAIYFALSSLGVGALLLSSYNAFFLVKWAGAAYLFYLGMRAITGRHQVLAVQAGAAASLPALWSGGVFLQLSNPKAIVFFTAIVPQFVDAKRPIGLQVLILGVTSILCEFVVLSGYGMMAGRAAEWARQPRYATWTNRAAGALLIVASVAMAMLRRD